MTLSRLLVAVVLSAQCTDARVNTITPILFARANNPYDMAKLSVETIQAIIRPCGLSPMKSKGIKGLSQMIVGLHDGQVPKSFEALEAMPSVGHKTASVVMSQAFGIACIPGRYAHPSLDASMDPKQWAKCSTNRERRQAPFP